MQRGGSLLSKKQLTDVCLLGAMSYDTCRYCQRDAIDYMKWYCVKLYERDQKKIDKKIYDYLIDCDQKGISPYASNVPLGDNCSGYPLLKTIEQGYDK